MAHIIALAEHQPNYYKRHASPSQRKRKIPSHKHSLGNRNELNEQTYYNKWGGQGKVTVAKITFFSGEWWGVSHNFCLGFGKFTRLPIHICWYHTCFLNNSLTLSRCRALCVKLWATLCVSNSCVCNIILLLLCLAEPPEGRRRPIVLYSIHPPRPIWDYLSNTCTHSLVSQTCVNIVCLSACVPAAAASRRFDSLPLLLVVSHLIN